MRRQPVMLLAMALVAASLATGCGGATTTPSTQPTAIPTGAPTASASAVIAPTAVPGGPPLPSADGWPFTAPSTPLPVPTFGPDGTAYVDVTIWPASEDPGGSVEYARLAAIDASGRMRPGWPAQLGTGRLSGLVVGSDGLVTVLVETIGSDPYSGTTYSLHRLGSAGLEVTGWPVVVEEAIDCSEPVVADDGSAYLACEPTSEEGSWRVSAFDAQGGTRAGWPATLEMWYKPTLKLGSDGTLFLWAGAYDGSGQLHALGSDGRDRSGWPVATPVGTGDFLLAPDGSVRLISYVDLVGSPCIDAGSTSISAIGANGRTLPGWPRTIDGAAIEPVIDPQGTIYVASTNVRGSSPGQVKVVAIGTDGSTRAGWPVAPAGFTSSCPDRSLRLGLSPAGTLYLLGNTDDPRAGRVIALEPTGQTVSGWPFETGLLETGCNACAPGSPPQAPVFGSDGTVYLAAEGASEVQVVALDTQAGVRSGWPYPLPFGAEAPDFVQLTVGPNGNVYVALLSMGMESSAEDVATLLVLRPDGSPAHSGNPAAARDPGQRPLVQQDDLSASGGRTL